MVNKYLIELIKFCKGLRKFIVHIKKGGRPRSARGGRKIQFLAWAIHRWAFKNQNHLKEVETSRSKWSAEREQVKAPLLRWIMHTYLQQVSCS